MHHTQAKMSQIADVHKVWQECLKAFRTMVDAKSFETWFLPIVPVSIEDHLLTLQVPSQFFCEFLETHFVFELQTVLHRVIGTNAGLRYNALVDSTSRSKNSLTLMGNSVSGEQPVTPQASETEAFESHLIPKFTFQNFFLSECNRVARSIAEAIADNPGSAPMNPFFIYGPSGVGKTHLCHAIGLRIKEKWPHMKVLYVTSHLFGLQYTSATKKQKNDKDSIADFINFYQQIDVLIIDDVQFFIGKTKTQNTFFEIFNHLYMLGKQIILTCDQPPVDLSVSDMEDRLITRISGALTVQLDRPDIDLRKEILRHKCIENGIELSPDVIQFIAENVHGNVRELQGTLHSLVAHATVTGCELGIRFVKKIVKQSVKIDKKEVSINNIEQVVCEQMQVSRDSIRSKSRKQDVAQARQMIMYLSKKHTDLSLAAIGELMGGRTHATVLHSCQVVENLMSVSSQFTEQVNGIERLII